MAKSKEEHSDLHTPPLAPRLECLPLADLAWDAFEAFCCDLISKLPGVRACHRYGTHGDTQLGIDLFAEILVEALDHPAPEVRSQAVWKMAILAAKDGTLLAPLTQALADKDDNVRRSAVFALQKVGKLNEAAVPNLVQALKKASRYDVLPIVEILGAFGPKAREALPVLVSPLLARHRTRSKNIRTLA
jgi:hypothetical protein